MKTIFALILFFTATAQAADIEASFAALDDGRFQSYVEIGHKIEKLSLRPFASFATGMDEWTGRSFHPADITFIVGLDYIWRDFTLTAYHTCLHPIDRYGTVTEYNALKITWTYGK
jgi:hypothetical protein